MTPYINTRTHTVVNFLRNQSLDLNTSLSTEVNLALNSFVQKITNLKQSLTTKYA